MRQREPVLCPTDASTSIGARRSARLALTAVAGRRMLRVTFCRHRVHSGNPPEFSVLSLRGVAKKLNLHHGRRRETSVSNRLATRRRGRVQPGNPPKLLSGGCPKVLAVPRSPVLPYTRHHAADAVFSQATLRSLL